MMTRIDIKYLNHFHSAVTGGFICGLQHPIEWVTNYLRSSSLYSPEALPELEEACMLMLCEFFEFDHLRPAKTGKEICTWLRGHYPIGHLCHGEYDGMEETFEQFLPKGETAG